MEERRRERAIELSQTYDGAFQESPPRTPTFTPAIERSRENHPYIKSSPPVPRARHQRSRSYSTVDDHFHTGGTVPGTNLQIRIDQCDGPAPEGTRPRTAGHPKSFQSLDVQIPHYNLGSPRFSPNGTPFLYGTSSLNPPSTMGEAGSSSHASQQIDGRWLWPSIDPRQLSPAFSPSDANPIPIIRSPPIPSTDAPANVNPEIYDRLSFPPSSEDPAIVRYDSHLEISAAISARIIAQITSAAFVDYHLLSDFFLTYRLFMNARDLAAHLIARLRWAIDRGDDTGKVVRVRTFVAIRHWLLNYFADDFVPSLVFRQEFANIMNDLTYAVRTNGNASDLKIIGELKKCWRRTCALYWDYTENAEADVDEDILPGGPPGTRQETLERPQSTMFRLPQLQLKTPPPRLDITRPDKSSGSESFLRDVVHRRAVTMFERKEAGSQSRGGGSPLRSQSRSTVQSKSSASAPTSNIPEMRKTPSTQSLSTKKNFPGGPHKRSGSFSDALRDNRYPLPLPNSIAKSTQLLMAFPYAGSLVRGNLFPPTPAYVEVIAPSTPVNEFASINFGFETTTSSSIGGRSRPDKHLTVPNTNKTASGPGVKRLLGSMRKALGGKPSHPKSETPYGAPSVRVTRSSSTRSNMSAVESLAASASRLGMDMAGDGRVARIDLLGAGAVDAFQRAMMAEENPQTRQERHEDGGTMTSIDGLSRDGGVSSIGGSSIGGFDGPIDGKADMAKEGSIISFVADRGTGSNGSIASTKDFLDSPSTLNPTPVNEPASVLGGLSFLADESEPSGSSRNSVRAAAPPERRSVLLRRSKSFSFGWPSPFDRYTGNIDERTSFIHPDIRSLRSVRSFSVNRVNSMLSQFSSVMDNISEISEFGSRQTAESPLPRGLLRRRPGGNLRAAATIDELDHPRPMSTGSIATSPFSYHEDINGALSIRPRQRAFSPSDRSSKASGPRPIAPGVVSLGAMGKAGVALSPPSPVPEFPPETPDPATPVPDNRASFEAGVQMLRELDDESDDGGIEVALAKLEGTYQRKKSGDTTPAAFDLRRSLARSRDLESSLVMVEEDGGQTGYDGVGDEEEHGYNYDVGEPAEHNRRLRRRHKQVLDQAPLETPPILDGSTSDQNVRDESEDSVPILERGLSIHAFGGPSKNKLGLTGSFGTGKAGKVDLDRVDAGLKQHLRDRDHDDNASDLSSELSFEVVQQGTEGGSPATFPAITPGTIISELGIPSHPLRHPPSPPLTSDQTRSRPNKLSVGESPRHASRLSGSARDEMSPQSGGTRRTARSEDTPRRSRESEILEPTAIHLPFILAYDSELLAKQFTLIEKDALLEVDWKELVELSWSQADTDVKDWVELLSSRDIRGVEVVIARFNLMCRWARSEIVMTKSVDERARTIVKFIHIAAHARQMHNYATMYQITIALLTADIARLRKTWELVSPAELHTFKELEALVQPVRNFHNLRTEMEKVTGETGCIPFVGLFTHDLILNAQRPPFLHFTQPNMPSLVNFERHRMTAAIVKRLLRLIEASHKYTFAAVDGVCERCLWISALDDDEIRGLSKGIEP
ncbi:hypothetical protein FN846DRAFT_771072 [Sphaerosporella brunnea]|uniref:Ras guanine nucleotide exchange factor domain-containing protein n=1 Tax=Sphaerosporella brunnea TaxID=1250544 RepID=A0A5J5FAB1_9PEZI|nr:hypothetical protein FN846DRAFT_771072 [Sphaerosporella brunnea]